jgi:hypothetical protein
MIINCIYNMNRCTKSDKSASIVKRFAILKGLQAKIVY